MKGKLSLISRLLLGAVLVLLAGCVEPFNPKVKNASANLLVVDGFINSQGVSTIKLSRTINLDVNRLPPPEPRAVVFIEAEGGAQYNLTEGLPGTYSSPALTLDPGKKYRLRFTTAAGKVYASDFVAVKTTPEIDRVSWEALPTGLQLSVSTHDPQNQTRYYRWDYDETWEFTSAFNAYLEWRNNQVQRRTDNIYRCWTSEKSTPIRLGNSLRLTQDVIANQPLAVLPPNSLKLRYKYTVNVRQYAQSAEEYAYWDNLRKNTENIGTLFDPLPSQLTGNVRSLSNADEPVIGYVGAFSVAEKRLFITRGELPRSWDPLTGYEDCIDIDTVLVRDMPDIFGGGNYVPLEPLYNFRNQIWAYQAAVTDCVDCRRRGTNVQPPFWQ
ncbi:DUF4249 domain-containing protein [Hymenobacter sp. B81]|uniref:DUF4249 domain-containing protein n=1 Tax=Hymenobacter sp. B81 TaxID=3344878 RepID=UPI0037DDD581